LGHRPGRHRVQHGPLVPGRAGEQVLEAVRARMAAASASVQQFTSSSSVSRPSVISRKVVRVSRWGKPQTSGWADPRTAPGAGHALPRSAADHDVLGDRAGGSARSTGRWVSMPPIRSAASRSLHGYYVITIMWLLSAHAPVHTRRPRSQRKR
jgi:hypothetical protein